MSDLTKKLMDLAADAAANFNLEAIGHVTRETLAQTMSSMSDKDRTAVRAWAASAREIRGNAALSAKEKDERIQALDNNTTIFKLLRALLATVADKAPIQQRQVVKIGLTAAAMATAGLNFEITGLAMIALRAALPAFLLSETGEKFCALLLDAPRIANS